MTHERRGLELAVDILRNIKTKRLKNGDPLLMKIGINTGKVIAGVVGHHKPQFSLVGDTVNVAARMGSTVLEYNTIQISERSFIGLGDQVVEKLPHLEFIANSVYAKGKGDLNSYLVKEKTLDPLSRKITVEAKAQMKLVNSETDSKIKTTIRKKETFGGDVKKIFKSNKKQTQFESKVMKKLEQKSKKNLLMRQDSNLVGNVDLFKFSIKENKGEQKFRREKIEKDKHVVWRGVLAMTLIYLFLTVIKLIAYVVIEGFVPLAVIIADVVIFVLVVGILILSKTNVREVVYYPWIQVSILSLISFLAMFNVIFAGEHPLDFITMLVVYNVLLINLITGAFVVHTMFLSIFATIVWLIVAAIFFYDQVFLLVGDFILLLVMISLNGYTFYSREYHLRTIRNLEFLAQKEIKQTESLVRNLLPPHVYESVKEDRMVTEKLENTTLLYADICGFTAWSSDKQPIQVVEMLSDLFKRFDKLCEENELYKVCTIGDCYVIMSYRIDEFGSRNEVQECLDVLKMSTQMIGVIKQTNEDQKINLNMRIGIHTGEVIAGITGTNVVRYDIYGPDVLMANKMESGGIDGRINVSEVSRAIIDKAKPGENEWEFNATIIAKGVNRQSESYFLKLPAS
jgi:class 3 adenylate cyclase